MRTRRYDYTSESIVLPDLTTYSQRFKKEMCAIRNAQVRFTRYSNKWLPNSTRSQRKKPKATMAQENAASTSQPCTYSRPSAPYNTIICTHIITTGNVVSSSSWSKVLSLSVFLHSLATLFSFFSLSSSYVLPSSARSLTVLPWTCASWSRALSLTASTILDGTGTVVRTICFSLDQYESIHRM